MQIQITGRDLDITDALKADIQERFKHLTTHLDKIISAHFTLSVEKNRQIAEAQLTIPGTAIHATAECDDMYASIEVLYRKLIAQIDKYKDKQNNHR